MALVPSVVDFESVKVGETADRSASLFNGGKDTLHIDKGKITVDPSDAVTVAVTADVDLAPGTSMSIPLTWSPTTANDLDATLAVATEARRLTARVKGTALT